MRQGLAAHCSSANSRVGFPESAHLIDDKMPSDSPLTTSDNWMTLSSCKRFRDSVCRTSEGRPQILEIVGEFSTDFQKLEIRNSLIFVFCYK
ncbi:Hypothetical protein NTJ_15379 [Nesidiocoris tenuis]|uniref:Uncharacterized protein n=1 Tax=Nesidiocoris tenuis TaxID=355587 RepID=A0ABN7BDV9_9HEMI|nr:Hypothetical protein NTJ_15379 [Nesidiocoris tenuis]